MSHGLLFFGTEGRVFEGGLFGELFGLQLGSSHRFLFFGSAGPESP